LDNAIQRALILQQGGVIHAEELCLDSTGHGWMAVAESHAGVESVSCVGRTEFAVTERQLCSSDNAGVRMLAENDVADQAERSTDILNRSDIDLGGLGADLKKREFQIIVDTIKNCGKRKLAAEKLGISPRTLRYKIAQMRDFGIDVEAELAV
jgi:two-component system response regulator FlrC